MHTIWFATSLPSPKFQSTFCCWKFRGFSLRFRWSLERKNTRWSRQTEGYGKASWISFSNHVKDLIGLFWQPSSHKRLRSVGLVTGMVLNRLSAATFFNTLCILLWWVVEENNTKRQLAKAAWNGYTNEIKFYQVLLSSFDWANVCYSFFCVQIYELWNVVFFLLFRDSLRVY